MVDTPPSGRPRAAGPRAPAATPPGAPPPAAPDTANLEQGEREQDRVEAGRDPAGPVRAASLAEASAALLDRPVELPDGGPGIGAAHVAERTEGFAMRPIGTVGEELRRAGEDARRVPPVTRAVLPRRDFAIDPDTVPGHRWATAAAQLRRNGRTYQPGVEVRIDYRAYLELVAIAGIVGDPWDRLPLATEPEGPEPTPTKV